MKKIISFILALVCCFSPVSVFAQMLPSNSFSNPIGYLTDENGNTIEIEGFIVNNDIAPLADNDEFSQTYGFNVPLSVAPNDHTLSGPDDGYESTIYLTLYYTTKNEGATLYRLNAVAGRWVINNPNNVSVTSAFLRYGCSDAISFSQAGSCYVENNFHVATGFANYITTYGAGMGANLTLKYLMGNSRTWTFTFTNNILDEAL